MVWKQLKEMTLAEVSIYEHEAIKELESFARVSYNYEKTLLKTINYCILANFTKWL